MVKKNEFAYTRLPSISNETLISFDRNSPNETAYTRNAFGEITKTDYRTLMALQNTQQRSQPVRADLETAEREGVLKLLSEKYQVVFQTPPSQENFRIIIEKALRNAAVNGAVEDLKLFLKLKNAVGFNIDGVAGNGKLKTSLHHSLSHHTSQHRECTKLLINAGANVDLADETGVTARQILAARESLQVIESQLPQSTPQSRSLVNELFNSPAGDRLRAVEDTVNRALAARRQAGNGSFFGELMRAFQSNPNSNSSAEENNAARTFLPGIKGMFT